MLSFNELRQANVTRLPQFKNNIGEPAHTEADGSDWSVSEWLEAVIGELGEFANLHKKFRRGDFGKSDGLEATISSGVGLITVRQVLADELADVVIYLDILAFRLGIDLGKAVVSKFDQTSRKVGSDVRLGPDND